MSEPTLPDAGAERAAERLHPLFLLTGLGGSLRGLAGGYAFIGYLLVSGRWTAALLGTLALLAFMAVGIFLYWTRFEFRVGGNDIRIDSGILSRTHRSIPFDRIQDVDITQGPVARLLGLAKVKFETGGSAGAGEDEGVLHAITLERAEQIRRLVRAARSDQPELPAATAAEDARPVYTMTGRRLLLAGTFNFSLALFAGLIGATQTFGDVLGFDPFSRTFWTRMLSAGTPIADFVLEHRLAAGIAGALLLVLAGLLTGITRTALRDYGFRLDRTEVGLRRRRGLLTRTDVTLPVKRAQAAIIATGPVRDGLGWRELKLQSLAQDEGGSGDHVLAPLARDGEIAGILGELGWRPVAPDADWKRVSKAYVWMRAIALSPFLLAVGLNLALFAAAPLWVDERARDSVAAAILPGLVPVLLVFAVLVLAVATRWLAWRRTAYALDGDRLLMRSGWLRRRTIILPLRRIQSIDLSDSFFSRRFGVASLRFGVAGGRGFSAHLIPAIPSATARQLREQLLESTT